MIGKESGSTIDFRSSIILMNEGLWDGLDDQHCCIREDQDDGVLGGIGGRREPIETPLMILTEERPSYGKLREQSSHMTIPKE